MTSRLSITLACGCLMMAGRAWAQLTLIDVQAVVAQAVTRASEISTNSVVAVTDREGFVIGAWSVNGTTPATADFTNLVVNAITKAGTAAFLSSDKHAFSTRTAGFIVQQNFPPGVKNKPPGPLVGVNFSSLFFSDINRIKAIPFGPGMLSGTNGAALPPLVTGGLAGTAGGLPLYKDGRLVGGVGVAGDGDGPTDITPETVLASDIDEDVALAGQIGFAPAEKIFGSHVFIDGIRVPYVNSSTSLGVVAPLGTIGIEIPTYPLTNPPPVSYPAAVLGGVAGELRAPIIADPLPGLINGEARLTAAEVESILTLAARRARTTRAGIRLPRGQSAEVFIAVVNNPNANGVAPAVLGVFRTGDATIFSWDVAVQKARTALFFSATNRAYSTRTVGFMAQSMYPPGIDGAQPGIFLGLQERFSLFPEPFPPPVTNPLNGATVSTPQSVNPNLPNGITIFPGGFPLYRNGALIGAIGVSGDGVDQDDIIGASGTVNFQPPESIRADRFFYRGARLPYAKFPRNPAL